MSLGGHEDYVTAINKRGSIMEFRIWESNDSYPVI
jgi:hypothetical protein